MQSIGQKVTCETVPWFALRIQSKLASLAVDSLGAKGYETFLPMYAFQRRWSDRVKLVNAPLFPGYLFCRFDHRESLRVLITPGVSSILGVGSCPIAVEEAEIEAVRSIVKSGLATETCPFLTVGTKVYLSHGPLAGMEGILTNAKRVDRLIVSVTLLQRSVAVEIDRAWALPVTDQGHSSRFAARA